MKVGYRDVSALGAVVGVLVGKIGQVPKTRQGAAPDTPDGHRGSVCKIKTLLGAS